MKHPTFLLVLATATALIAAPALAANNGNHGNSGSHGNAGGNGNGNAYGLATQEASVSADDTSSPGNSHHNNVTALAGAGNAAHASIQGLLHANAHSAVGRVRAYADVNFEAQQLDATTAQALTACNTALSGDSNASSLGGDCSTLTLDALTAANVSQATIDAFNTYAADKTASDTADASAQQALLTVTKNGGNAQVKSYIDGLLAKYYAYLSAQ